MVVTGTQQVTDLLFTYENAIILLSKRLQKCALRTIWQARPQPPPSLGFCHAMISTLTAPRTLHTAYAGFHPGPASRTAGV